jgi:ankyrin repeat protein
MLQEHAKDKNPADSYGNTPLHMAAMWGHLEIVKLLLEHVKDKNPVNNRQKTPIQIAEEYGHVPRLDLHTLPSAGNSV